MKEIAQKVLGEKPIPREALAQFAMCCAWINLQVMPVELGGSGQIDKNRIADTKLKMVVDRAEQLGFYYQQFNESRKVREQDEMELIEDMSEYILLFQSLMLAATKLNPKQLEALRKYIEKSIK